MTRKAETKMKTIHTNRKNMVSLFKREDNELQNYYR